MSQRPPQDEILIGVLGVTGSGKTTFISKATGRNDLVIGHTLEACTQVISLSQLTLNGKTITLIDTPGFDDTNRTDADILNIIANHLAESYNHGVLLSGIILCQPIDDNRFRGSEKDRTRLFEEVCGENAFGNVILNTTMWSNVQGTIGHDRVRERVKNWGFWGKMVDKGATVAVCDNTRQGALNIIKMILGKREVALKMQVELKENGGDIPSTSAGKQLNATLDGVTSQLINEIRQLRLNHTLQQDLLRQQVQELQETVRQLRGQQTTLKNSRVSLPSYGDSAAWVAALSTLAGVGISGAVAMLAKYPEARFEGPGVVCYVANRSSTNREVQFSVSEGKANGSSNWSKVTTIEIGRRQY